MKNIRFFLSEKFHSLEVKFSVYLIKHVFAMDSFTLIFLLSENWPLTYSSLWTHSANDTLMIVFLCCQKTALILLINSNYTGFDISDKFIP